MARASSGALRDEEATAGAVGRGGSTEMLTGGVGEGSTEGAACEEVAGNGVSSVTAALYRKASAGSAPVAVEEWGAELSARSGLMGRHSSSNVTERLEMTVLVAG